MCVCVCVCVRARALMRTSKHVERVVLFHVPKDGSGGGGGNGRLGGGTQGGGEMSILNKHT